MSATTNLALLVGAAESGPIGTLVLICLLIAVVLGLTRRRPD